MAVKSSIVVEPNFGLYLGRPSMLVPLRGLEDGKNVRIKLGKVSSYNMGWEKFSAQQLNGPITQIDNFFLSTGASILIVGTLTDLYRWDAVGEQFLYITETYTTGTVSTTGASSVVTGVGTLWDTVAIDGDNARPGDEIYLHTTGNAAQNDPNPAVGAWFPIVSVASNTSLTVTGTPPAITAQAYTIRRKFASGSLPNYWRTQTFPRADITGTGTPIEDTWFATNGGQDHPVQWNGSDTFVSRFDPGFKCQELIRFKNMLLYLNVVENAGTQKPFSFKNSDVGRPKELATGLAGEFVAAPGTARIVTALPIGDNLAVYTENEVVLMTFVGAPETFAFRTSVTGTGLLAGRLVAQFTDTHQFLGRDSLYDFNGIQASAVDEHVWVDALRRQNQDNIRNGHIVFDEENGDLIWALPLSTDTSTEGEPRNAYVAHYLENMPQGIPTPYTFRDFPFSAAGFFQRDDVLTWADLTLDWTNYNFAWGDRFFAAAFPLILGGGPDGFVYTLNTVDHQDGVGFPSYATFGRRFIGDYKARNLVRRVYPMTRQTPGAVYTLSCSTTVYDAEGQLTGSTTVNQFDLTSTVAHFVSPYRRGRLAQVQFGTLGSATGEPWEIHGYDWWIVPGGER